MDGSLSLYPPIATGGQGSYREAMVETWGRVPESAGRRRPPTHQQAQPDWRYLRVIKHHPGYRRTGVMIRVVSGEEDFARRWAGTARRVGVDGAAPQVQKWGEHLARGLDAWGQDHPVALEGKPRASALARRGAACWWMDRHEEALADSHRALELGPEEDWYHYKRAPVHRAIGQEDQARTDLTAAIACAQAVYAEKPQAGPTPSTWPSTTWRPESPFRPNNCTRRPLSAGIPGPSGRPNAPGGQNGIGDVPDDRPFGWLQASR